MTTNTKIKPHKSCSCSQCMRGKRTDAGHFQHRIEERRLRRVANRDLKEIVKGGDLDAPVTVRVRNDYTY